MYEIQLSPKARRQFRKLEKETQKRIEAVFSRLNFNPERYVTKLVGIDAYRIKVGQYRIILKIKKDILFILVIEIGHRRNIYKRMKTK